MADGKQSSLSSFVVPIMSFSSIEYPGYVKSIDRAMEALGGRPAVRKVFAFQEIFYLHLGSLHAFCR